MGRLTEKRRFKYFRPDEETTTVCVDGYIEHVEIDDDSIKKEHHYYLVGEAFDKLAEYEDLEEQGLLLRLPCKVGQEVYVIVQGFNIKNNTSMHKIFTRHIVQIRGNKLNPIYFVTEVGDSFVPSCIGKTVFLTIEEAEAAIEKLKGEHNVVT